MNKKVQEFTDLEIATLLRDELLKRSQSETNITILNQELERRQNALNSSKTAPGEQEKPEVVDDSKKD